MNRPAYNKLQHEAKRSVREAIKQLQQEDPERYKALQERARQELEHPTPREVIHLAPAVGDFDIEKRLRMFRASRKDYYVRTKDKWGDEHLYFELLIAPTQALEVMQRWECFKTREEEITSVEACTCPLCS
jgi:hypothetical protein